jgi:hypothetical protein
MWHRPLTDPCEFIYRRITFIARFCVFLLHDNTIGVSPDGRRRHLVPVMGAIAVAIDTRNPNRTHPWRRLTATAYPPTATNGGSVRHRRALRKRGDDGRSPAHHERAHTAA